VLACDSDNLLIHIDQKSAVGRLMLGGSLEGEDYRTALNNADIEEIKAERKNKTGGHAILVFEGYGEIETKKDAKSCEYEKFIIAFDAVDEQIIRQTHRSEIEAMKLAVALESASPSKFIRLNEGVYLTNDENKVVYSISFSFYGEGSNPTNLSTEDVERISARYDRVQQANNMESVQRLISAMVDSGSDRLETFLSAWKALEKLIEGSFKKTYKQKFLSQLESDKQPILRKLFSLPLIDNIKNGNCCHITDKFCAVTAVLFPKISDSEFQKDYEIFYKSKKLRNDISHGNTFSEEDLPVHELKMLLRKYILAHIAWPYDG
jgi:hypothetical protein